MRLKDKEKKEEADGENKSEIKYKTKTKRTPRKRRRRMATKEDTAKKDPSFPRIRFRLQCSLYNHTLFVYLPIFIPHSPSYKTDMFFFIIQASAFSAHRLPYVLLSDPHTGL